MCSSQCNDSTRCVRHSAIVTNGKSYFVRHIAIVTYVRGKHVRHIAIVTLAIVTRTFCDEHQFNAKKRREDFVTNIVKSAIRSSSSFSVKADLGHLGQNVNFNMLT